MCLRSDLNSVSVQVRKAPITHNSSHKIPWQLPLQIFWSFPVSEKQYYKCNCCQSRKSAQGYARSDLETQGSVSEVLMAGWVANANGKSLKFTSCCHRKIRARRRPKFERAKSERRKIRKWRTKGKKCVVVLLQKASQI